jgi:hypothetical protein
MNRTIKEILASMLMDAKISMRFWHYGLKHACVLWNTGRMFEGVALEERVHKRRIEYSKIQAFGAECWVSLRPEKRPKADLTVPKAWKGRLLPINYPGTGFIVLLDGEPEKAVVSRDVVFKRVLDDEPIGDRSGDSAVSTAGAVAEGPEVPVPIVDLGDDANAVSGGNVE